MTLEKGGSKRIARSAGYLLGEPPGAQPPTGTKVALSLFHPYSLRWGSYDERYREAR
jgi:hypothetical protein